MAMIIGAEEVALSLTQLHSLGLAGDYARPDAFQLKVDGAPKHPVARIDGEQD